jgi:3-oxoacyl-[acyl-carrier protein] reductase
VLGGTTHLGTAVVRELLAAGVETAATYRTREHAAPLAGAHLVAADAADPAGLRRALGGLCAEWGAPDAFVHCLTVGRPRLLAEITDADWAAAHDINVRSAFVAVQELAPRMAERGGGDLILTAALDGIQPVPAPAHFAASQAALLGMTRALAKELGPRGLRVNLVVLGVLDGGLAGALPSRLLADYKKFSALGRVGTAAEVARAVRWLALENRYMTGQTLSLSGGI